MPSKNDEPEERSGYYIGAMTPLEDEPMGEEKRVRKESELGGKKAAEHAEEWSGYYIGAVHAME